MNKTNHYYFHKDCIHFNPDNVHLCKDGKHEVIRFYCPKTKQWMQYYKSDFHKIRWQCGAFEAIQSTLFDTV